MDATISDILNQVSGSSESKTLMDKINSIPAVQNIENQYAIDAAKKRAAQITPTQWVLIGAGIIGLIYLIRKV